MSSEQEDRDRRRKPRKNITLPITVSGPTLSRPLRCSALDLSSEGMRFQSAAQFAVGTVVILSFSVPQGVRQFRISARVNSIAPDKGARSMIGVKFLNLHEDERRYLEVHVVGKLFLI
ncbi:PilZ domain-containing protein [Bdellovibrionota bacterium FG-2]